MLAESLLSGASPPGEGSGNQSLSKAVRPVRMWGLVALIFFSVSGGPFGSEGSVSAAGPFWAILGFALFPFIWCIPEALITAELSSVFPGNAGFSAWVCGAFGPYLGFIEGWLSWVSGVTSTAIYPHLFLEYAKHVFPCLAAKSGNAVAPARLGFLVLFPLLMSYVNFRGLDVVSKVGFVLMLIVLGPFIVIVVLGWTEMETGNFWIGYEHWPSLAGESADSPGGALLLFNILFWNLNNWDNTSTISGEVVNARKVIPRAIFFGFVIITSAYLLPLIVGVGLARSADGEISVADFSQWQAGHYQKIAQQVGGEWLASWVLLAASVAIIGQFQALISSNSYSIQAQAQLGWIPKFFAKNSQYDTPTVGIVLTVGAVLLMTTLDFMSILQMLNSVYCIAELLEFAAFLYLRIKYPDLNRPFKVPLGLLGCVLLLTMPVLFILLIFFLPLLAGRWQVLLYVLAVVLLGNGLYLIFELARKWRLFSFIRRPPRSAYELVAIYKTPAPHTPRSPAEEARPFVLS